MTDDYCEFRLMQDGIMVAGTAGPSEDAEFEIRHYALMYGIDGPVSIEKKTDQGWVKFG